MSAHEPRSRQLQTGHREIAALLLLLLCLLLLQARLTLHFEAGGRTADHALALARVLTLPVLVAAIPLVLRGRSRDLLTRLHPDALSMRILLAGVASGVLMRIAAWAELTARGSFGLLESASAVAATPLRIGFECPPMPVLATAVAAWLVVVPMTEELVHRGIVQSWLAAHGKWLAIAGSTLVFTLAHEAGIYPWVTIMGLLFGLQFWNARYLWLPLITHAVYDGLVPLDTLCLELAWNPPASALPAWTPGLVATGLVVACIAGAFWLAAEKRVGPVARADPPAE